MYLRNRILPYFFLVTVVTVKGGSNDSNLTMSSASGILTEPTITPNLSALLATAAFSSSTDSGTPKDTTTPSTASAAELSGVTVLTYINNPGSCSTVISSMIPPAISNSPVNSTSTITSSTSSTTGTSMPTSSSAGVTSLTSSRSSTVSMPSHSSAGVTSSTSSRSSTVSIPTSSSAGVTSSTSSRSLIVPMPSHSSARVTTSTSSRSSTVSIPTSSSAGVTPSTSSRSSTASMPTRSSAGVTSSTFSRFLTDATMTSMSSTPMPTDSGDTLVAAIAGAGGAIILMIVIFIVIMSVVLIYVVMKTPKKNKDDSKWITGKELVDLNQLENEEENCRMGAGGTGGEAKVESNMEGEKGSDDKEAQEDETAKVEKNGEGERNQVEETTDKVESSSEPKEANSDEQPKTDTLVTANQNEKEKGVPSNIDNPTALTSGTESSTPAKATTFVGSPSQTEAEMESKKLEDLLSGDSSNQEKKPDASKDGSKEPPVASPTSVVASDQPKDVTLNVSGTPEGDKVASTKEEAPKDSKT